MMPSVVPLLLAAEAAHSVRAGGPASTQCPGSRSDTAFLVTVEVPAVPTGLRCSCSWAGRQPNRSVRDSGASFSALQLAASSQEIERRSHGRPLCERPRTYCSPSESVIVLCYRHYRLWSLERQGSGSGFLGLPAVLDALGASGVLGSPHRIDAIGPVDFGE